MKQELKPGIKGHAELTVDEGVSPLHPSADGEMKVFGTPFVIALMEQASDKSVRSCLEPGCATVGTLVNMNHTAATPMGMRVRAESELLEVDGRRLVFRIAAYDEVGQIADGTHERFIIFKEKFMKKAENRGKEQ